MDFSVVTAHVATGAAVSSEADVEALVAAGITHVIDCREEFDDAPLLASHPALSYLWNGTPDDGATKPPEWFQKSLAFALPALAATPVVQSPIPVRPVVYAHCAAGMNRGPSTAYAILLALNFAPNAAETAIRAVRPQVELRYKQDAINALKEMGF